MQTNQTLGNVTALLETFFNIMCFPTCLISMIVNYSTWQQKSNESYDLPACKVQASHMLSNQYTLTVSVLNLTADG